MKRILCLAFLFNLYITSYNQVITGSILDMETKKPVAFADIYFNGTLQGTTADKLGHFKLDITKYASRPVTISAVGYYSFMLSDYTPDESHLVFLTPKIYELEEVEVIEESLILERKANLRLFKKEFLGYSANARSCEILNESALTFNYRSDEDTLKAFAHKPLFIHNRALGYRITFYLDKFEYARKGGDLSFHGNIKYSEDSITQRRFSERRRRITFRGSRMHFFRALWNDDLESNGFVVKDSAWNIVGYEDIVLEEGNTKKILASMGDLMIVYGERSHIMFSKEKVLFEPDGFFDPKGITWKGFMGKKRVGDWLPYEYSYE